MDNNADTEFDANLRHPLPASYRLAVTTIGSSRRFSIYHGRGVSAKFCTMQLTPEHKRLWKIFHPYAADKEATARSQGTRFVHYTSAAAAMSILENQKVWMRKSTCMNDSSEVRHGLERLAKAYNHSDAGQRLRSILDSMFTGLRAEIEKGFNDFKAFILLDTYLTCVSEHRDEEDTLGRLSMWRAYGVTTGVALVMNNSAFLTPNDVLKAYASPVAYCDDDKFTEEFAKVVNNVEAETDFLKQQDRELIRDTSSECSRSQPSVLNIPVSLKKSNGGLSTVPGGNNHFICKDPSR